MIETKMAKLFKNGASQAVRLPAEFRFEGSEVYVTRDDATGDVVLSSRPGAKTWNEFFDLLRATNVPDEFMADRPLNVAPPEGGLFDDEITALKIAAPKTTARKISSPKIKTSKTKTSKKDRGV
jgi:antitoxin VapB